MPNTGAIEEADFKSLLQEYSENARPIHTTVVGVGIDFNTELTEAIMKVRGKKYIQHLILPLLTFPRKMS